MKKIIRVTPMLPTRDKIARLLYRRWVLRPTADYGDISSSEMFPWREHAAAILALIESKRGGGNA